MQPVAEGVSRFSVKSEFGLGNNLEILDENERKVCFVDGKFGIRPFAEVRDASGRIVYKMRGQLMGIPKKVTLLDADDHELATIKAKLSPVKNEMNLEAADGTNWHLEGDLVEKEYTVTAEGRTIIHIDQKLTMFRDAYLMDVDDSVPLVLAAAFVWAAYSFREQK